jgi:hypothetical protein
MCPAGSFVWISMNSKILQLSESLRSRPIILRPERFHLLPHGDIPLLVCVRDRTDHGWHKLARLALRELSGCENRGGAQQDALATLIHPSIFAMVVF